MSEGADTGIEMDVPDLMRMLPNGDRKKVILFCLNELHLNSDEAYNVLNGATRVLYSINLLLRGGPD